MSIHPVKSYNYRDIFSLHKLISHDNSLLKTHKQSPSYQIFWIKKGKGTFKVDFDTYEFENDTLFFLFPGQYFSINSEHIEEAYQLVFDRDFYCVLTHDKEIACNGTLFYHIFKNPLLQPLRNDTQKLNFILENLIEEFSSKNTAKYDMLQSYLKQFIIHFVRIKKEDECETEDIETKLFKDYILLVEQNFKQLHAVSNYASRLLVSPKSLAKHFHKLGLPTPSDIIKSRIVLEAKRQLLYTSETVKEIAFDLGFNDSAYFSRFFTKATKTSPIQFRKEHKN